MSRERLLKQSATTPYPGIAGTKQALQYGQPLLDSRGSETRQKSGRAWSLSEIEFGERKINNLRKCSGAQVIDSSFENSYLRQTPCPTTTNGFAL